MRVEFILIPASPPFPEDDIIEALVQAHACPKCECAIIGNKIIDCVWSGARGRPRLDVGRGAARLRGNMVSKVLSELGLERDGDVREDVQQIGRHKNEIRPPLCRLSKLAEELVCGD